MTASELPTSQIQTAIFGGGCFWCTEAVFARLNGVVSVTSGYAGGSLPNPSYDKVSMGTTNHAEVIQITFDPTLISYEQLLDIFWDTHDATTLNQQGADIGTQYRSVIFFVDESQYQLAKQKKAELQGHSSVPIVTKIEPLDTFYPAEEYHQRYYDRNQTQPYCEVVISPKIQKLFNRYPNLLKKPL